MPRQPQARAETAAAGSVQEETAAQPPRRQSRARPRSTRTPGPGSARPRSPSAAKGAINAEAAAPASSLLEEAGREPTPLSPEGSGRGRPPRAPCLGDRGKDPAGRSGERLFSRSPALRSGGRQLAGKAAGASGSPQGRQRGGTRGRHWSRNPETYCRWARSGPADRIELEDCDEDARRAQGDRTRLVAERRWRRLFKGPPRNRGSRFIPGTPSGAGPASSLPPGVEAGTESARPAASPPRCAAGEWARDTSGAATGRAGQARPRPAPASPPGGRPRSRRAPGHSWGLRGLALGLAGPRRSGFPQPWGRESVAHVSVWEFLHLAYFALF